MDTLDPDLIEAAQSELAAWTRRTPEVAALAGVASLARSIEPELLRALRIGLGTRLSPTGISVSAETALWFSSFVESRGTDAITLLPEALHVLRPQLAADPQLLKDARTIVEECHKSGPDVLQWEERIVYLALTEQTTLLEEEIRRGLRSVSQGTRQPLVSWISDMWLRLPPAAKSNPLLVTLYQHVKGLVRRQSPSASGGASSGADLLFDFSAFPTRELGVVLRDNRFLIGNVPDAEFGIAVPDLEPVELDVAFGSSNSWVEQRTVKRGEVVEIDIQRHDTIRVRTLAGRIHELSPALFRRPAKRFAVALSFPGEKRDFVSKVADALAIKFGKQRVLYDKYHEAESARPNLNIHLPELYSSDSELVAIFLCHQYQKKRWPKLEWRSIRQVIATADEDRIMFLSFDDVGAIPEIGILDGDGYVSIGDRSPEQIAELILSRSLTPEENPVVSPARFDISRIIKYAAAELIGRGREMEFLSHTWEKVVRNEPGHPNLLMFVGLGGEGKTSLVAKWVAELAERGWPGCEAAFAWSFYSQGASNQLQASSDSFLKEALNFFGDSEMANSAASAFDKGQRLAQLVGERRALLILDGLEPLQYPPTSRMPGELKDAGVSALLKFLVENNRGLCIITTRYSIADLRGYLGKTTAPQITLRRVSRKAAVHLLRSLGVRGTQTEFEKLVDDVKGHALTLNLIGNYLRDAYGGDIRNRALLKLEELDARDLGGSGFQMYAAYIRWLESEGERGERAVALLRLLGLFDRPATIESLSTLWQGEVITGLTEPLISLSETERNLLIKRLEDMKLLTVIRDRSSGKVTAIDADPLLRGYFAQQIRTRQPEAWRSAHRRLYEYLTKTTSEGSEPTLEDLQPLAQAIQSGCQAELHQEAFDEVYVKRLQRGNEGYVWRKLGAFGFDLGVITAFFEQPWLTLSPALSQEAQAFVLNNAALDLRALGRLTEALGPMRAAVEIRNKQSDWKNAAISADNLSDLELTLGEVALAVRDAEQAQAFADRSGDAFLRLARREDLADAYHQSGRLDEAESLFREAEVLQVRLHPDYPLLYSTGGFRYCDLLLGEPERAVWRAMLNPQPQSTLERLAALCAAVRDRAQTVRRIMDYGRDLLSPALDRLTTARAAAYLTILRDQRFDLKVYHEIDAAIDGLRRAGQQPYLPSGLLMRAFLRSLTGEPTGPQGAQEDLDEAWEIAERGPMRLHMADIHLYRARLFHAVKPYPWNKFADDSEGRGPKDDLADARKLIEQCGYWRRKEELEDAEEAAKSWT